MEMQMSGLLKRMYTPISFDLLFGTAGTIGMVGLVLEGSRPYPAIAAAAEPLTKGAALVGVTIASAVLAIVSTRLDQKMADDFVFHTLTKSAFIGMFVILFTAVFWQTLLADKFGGLSSYSMIGVLVVGWALSYFYTRLRGTRL
jgi:hypothetical protein